MLDAIIENLALESKKRVWMYDLCTMESDVSRHCRINIIVICRKRESNVPVSSHFAH